MSRKIVIQGRGSGAPSTIVSFCPTLGSMRFLRMCPLTFSVYAMQYNVFSYLHLVFGRPNPKQFIVRLLTLQRAWSFTSPTPSHCRLLRRSSPNAPVAIAFPVSVTLTTVVGVVIVEVPLSDRVYVFVHVVDRFPIQQFTQKFSTTVAVFVIVVVPEALPVALLVVFVTTTQQVSLGKNTREGRVYFWIILQSDPVRLRLGSLHRVFRGHWVLGFFADVTIPYRLTYDMQTPTQPPNWQQEITL